MFAYKPTPWCSSWREVSMSWSHDKGCVNEIKSVSPRLGDEELPWDAMGPKAEVTAFSASDLELDQRLGPRFWSSTHQEAVLNMGQVVKIKSWTVVASKEKAIRWERFSKL